MQQFCGKRLKTNAVFGYGLIVFSLFCISCILFQIFGYDKFLRPYLFSLPDGVIEKHPTAMPIFPSFISNNVSGLNYLGFFTVLSNLFTALYFLALGLSIIGVKKMQKIGFNKYIEGAITMYISITGIVYCLTMLPFRNYDKIGWAYDYPALAFYDIINYVHHIIVPVVMLVIWNLPFSDEKLDLKKFFKGAIVFPAIYSVIALLRGVAGGQFAVDSAGTLKTWWVYPFLAPEPLKPFVAILVGGEPSAELVKFFVALAYIVVALILCLTPIAIVKTHNKYLSKLKKHYIFDNDDDVSDYA